MELTFETSGVIGQGSSPEFIQFDDTSGELFFINGGRLHGTPSAKFNGDFSTPNWFTSEDVSPDNESGINHLEIQTIGGFGVVGTYTTPSSQKLLIYEFQHDITDYLESGRIANMIGEPVNRFSLRLTNPDIKDPNYPGTIIINEETSLLIPGSKILFEFGMGDDDQEYSMGTFFVDRSQFNLTSATVNIDGRNKIGKILKDQTVDENNQYWQTSFKSLIEKCLLDAKLFPDEFIVQNEYKQSWFTFDRSTTFYQALEKIMEPLLTWKIAELSDGTIVVGDEDFSAFDKPGTYVFQRNKDIFSRDIARDDESVYRRVCVHNKDFTMFSYKEVPEYQGWNLQANKTLYVEVADGYNQSSIDSYAIQLANQAANVGKLESFDGPFRPYLQIGDGATIVSSNGSNNLGLITEVTHEFGKNGFTTSFTVDSGGTINNGRVTDFIKKLSDRRGIGVMLGSSGINAGEYINIARYSRVTVSSIRSLLWDRALLTDGVVTYTSDTGQGWQPSDTDDYPFIQVDLGKECLVDKIKIWCNHPGSTPDKRPTYYRIEYWNSKEWITLLTQNGGITDEMTHNFSQTNTSAIRFILNKKVGEQNWREIEVWGNM